MVCCIRFHDSTGNPAACIAQKTLGDGTLAYPLTGLLNCVPWIFPLNKDLIPTRYNDIYPSREKIVAVPGLDRDSFTVIEDYITRDAASPLFSPFNSTTSHVGMPPTYILVCVLVPLRDDGIVYEKA